MSVRRLSYGLVLATGVLLSACTSSGASPTPPTSAPVAPSTQPPAAPTIGTATTSLGTVLAGPNGHTLYTHAGDGMNMSTCTGGCATAWPPLTVPGGHQAMPGTGVTGHLATFTRADGSAQVTYNGLPLYYWQGDAKAGDVTGQGVAGFSIASPTGAAPASSGAPSPSAKGGYGY